jgi:hypothetical protein
VLIGLAAQDDLHLAIIASFTTKGDSLSSGMVGINS